VSVDNDAITGTPGMSPFSLEQYQGTKDAFYDRVESLINPRPLEAKDALAILVDALHEQVKGRVLSVQNGEDFKAQSRSAIDMPTGHSVFETTGPWEDFSTPSRDMRLLIAIDTVLSFGDAVKRAPDRFGLGADAVEPTIAELEKWLAAELQRRRFEYVKSNGEKRDLALEDLVKRQKELEVAYNPNDCVEIRWGAPEGSDERATCSRHAPDNQQRLMQQYRVWFAERKRPPR
jgi:hypothetical protein